MHYVYLYVEKNVANDCIKYGMKLSEYADRIITLNEVEKTGITAFLSPQDSTKYDSFDYVCLKTNIEDDMENVFVCNNLDTTNNFANTNFHQFKSYIVGSFENPSCIITTSLLPENIFLYNKIIDTPLIVQNSRRFYYQKNILDLIDNLETEDLKQILENVKKLKKAKENLGCNKC